MHVPARTALERRERKARRAMLVFIALAAGAATVGILQRQAANDIAAATQPLPVSHIQAPGTEPPTQQRTPPPTAASLAPPTNTPTPRVVQARIPSHRVPPAPAVNTPTHQPPPKADALKNTLPHPTTTPVQHHNGAAVPSGPSSPFDPDDH
jgi:type IV secretory pathway VirB10-like protein